MYHSLCLALLSLATLAMASSKPPSVDHVVLLVHYSWLASPPPWISDNFFVSPGGKHADNRTENRLVLFSDGSYLELIAFIDDDENLRKGHYWDKPYGIVDYALTSDKDKFDWQAINDGIQRKTHSSDIGYDAPQAGGRMRPDGVNVQWEVTFPHGLSRGTIPFWCHDVTPRANRVPITAENTDHPSGVLGVAGIVVKADAQVVGPVLPAVVGASHEQRRYELERVTAIADTPLPSLRLQRPSAEYHSAESRQEGLALQLQVAAHKQAPPDIREDVDGGSYEIIFRSA